MQKPHVFDVTAKNFEKDVLLRSRTTPVLLDFWATWCGPCRTLGPVLESLAAEYGGAFELGKIDSDAEVELAQAFGVQSIPFCVLMAAGRPVDAFQGAQPASEVRRFLAAAGVEPLAATPPPAEAAPPPDPDAPATRLQSGNAAILRGDLAAARERLSGITEDQQEHASAARLLDGIAALEQPLAAAAGPASAAIGRGRGALRAGRLDDAVREFIDSIAADRAHAQGLARRHAVLCFELLAATPDGEERVLAYRRRLATLLF
ncbi:MAG: tetratricopeptide repeat protein [Planctomycetes bacterium]|nr:tetratricopeptide repeat protein [Planctomycetota bacterium]